MTYKIQIDELVRDATPEEVEQIEARKSEAEQRKAEAEARAAQKAALLDRLGITEDEAKLLLA
jgi:phosphopantetheine adenylyltransferase